LWRSTLNKLLTLVATAVVGTSAVAQDYPVRPIKAITVTSAGGTSDIFMRGLADRMQKVIGQPIVIENRPGGSFNIGSRACAEAAPDGYTICILPGEPLTFNQFLFKSLPYNPATFEPITRLFNIVLSLSVNKSLGVRTFGELIAHAKAHSGTLSYTSGSVAFSTFFDRVNKDAGADIIRVPYRGGADQVNALLSGSIPVAFTGLSNVRGQLEAGLFTGLMVDSGMRSPLFPDIPTIPEATGKQYQSRSYFTIVAPPGTPKTITAKLHAMIVEISSEPTFREAYFHARGLEPALSTSPEEFGKFIQQDRVLAAEVVREAGLNPQ